MHFNPTATTTAQHEEEISIREELAELRDMIKNLRNPPIITNQSQLNNKVRNQSQPIQHSSLFILRQPKILSSTFRSNHNHHRFSVPEQQQNDSCMFNMSPNLPLSNYQMIIANPPICPNQQQQQFQQQQQQGMNLLNYSIPALSNGSQPIRSSCCRAEISKESTEAGIHRA